MWYRPLHVEGRRFASTQDDGAGWWGGDLGRVDVHRIRDTWTDGQDFTAAGGEHRRGRQEDGAEYGAGQVRTTHFGPVHALQCIGSRLWRHAVLRVGSWKTVSRHVVRLSLVQCQF